jgi:two-component system cell cycle sensor histidine kinase/response regulator CckA
LSIIFENAPDAIYLLDIKGNFINGNRAAEEMIGYKREELIGKNLTKINLLPWNQIPKAAVLLAKNEYGKATGPDEFILNRKNGSQINVEISTFPVLFNKKKVVLGIARNISERKSIEQKNKKIQDLLYQSQKMESIGRLAGGVAHEFNNLLTGIIGFSELLLQQMKDPKMKRDIKLILNAAQQASLLSHQLLTFSRKRRIEFKSLNINSVIQKEKQMLNILVGERIIITYDLEPHLQEINSDTSLIEQIIINLASNARDAMPRGGTLTISTQNKILEKEDRRRTPEAREGNYICLTMRDTGVGMNEDTIHRMFEPFFGTKRVGEGAGMGLSVVYGIVKQHNGWIDVESKQGKGSQFNIYFPVASRNRNIQITHNKVQRKITGNGKIILVVEDEKIVRELTTRVLRENGYIVFDAENSSEARDIFEREQGRFDLVFSDVVMPDENGPQLVDYFLKCNPDLKVLFSSGYSDDRSKKHILIERGFPFLQKPFTPSDLLLSVRNTI